MANWLLKEESTFGTPAFELASSYSYVKADYALSPGDDYSSVTGVHSENISDRLNNISREKEYSILLNKVVILDNKKLFGSADVFFYSVIVNGLPDMKTKTPFWAQQLSFSNIKNGAVLSIDPEGVLLFKGKPLGFLNLYLFAVRDIETSREFAKKLKENFVAKGIGNVAAGLTTIFSGPAAPFTVPLARDAVTGVVDATLSYFEKQKNKVIGTYYSSLIEEKGYGVGFHPSDFPQSLLSCGESMNLAYCVLSNK